MDEPPKLTLARKHLSRAEAKFRSSEGLFDLEEGLALLEEVMGEGASAYRTVAQNLASTYAIRIYGCIRNLVETDRGLPEPDLEQLFKVALAFDPYNFDLPVETRSTKVNLVRHLIDRYYEGHSPAEKRKALQRLSEIAGSDEWTH